jgi:hypothetical protein
MTTEEIKRMELENEYNKISHKLQEEAAAKLNK